MTVVDLHPEDLLDKDARGELEASERVRLDAHLGRCAVCRFERQVRADFIADLAGAMLAPGLADPARDWAMIPIAEASGARIAGPAAPGFSVPSAPSASLPAEPSACVAPVRRSTPRPRRVRKRAAWLLAAGALFVGGAAAAAMSLVDQPWPTLRGALTTAESPAVPVAAITRTHTAGAIAPHPTAKTDDVEPIVAEPAALPVRVAAMRPRTTPGAPAAPATPTALTPARAVHVAPVIGPAELFDSEGDARRHGDYARVYALHRQLETHYAGSREARVSHVIVGRLLLDRGDPFGALGELDAYLGPAGSGASGASDAGDLAQEAMIGRATALERLGRSDDAARAWSSLLAAFPSSPYASHARARIETLNGR